MRKPIAALICLLICGVVAAPVRAQPFPAERASLPGQISVVTINARQNRVLDLQRFTRLFELALALRERPLAFNGGFAGAITAPDVIIAEEMSGSNYEIFRRLLNQRFAAQYELSDPESSAFAKLMYNGTTVSPAADPVTWSDPCLNGEGGRELRQYQYQRFIETATGRVFTVAGVHFKPKYGDTGMSDCKLQATRAMRAQLESEPSFVVAGGDFNARATKDPVECDPAEDSAPLPWWAAMTQPSDGGRVYTDAVRSFHRVMGMPLTDEWTHEQKSERIVCNGQVAVRRTRIDYLFTDAAVAEAHTDHPGWAGPKPLVGNPDNFRYSDHRFVAGRFVLGGPAQPVRPEATLGARGRISLQWGPVEGASSVVVYRARRGHEYSVVARLGAEATSFEDTETEHDRSYRYAIAAVAEDGAQGVESRPVRATADARGPAAILVTPRPGAIGVSRGTDVRVRFDERVDPASVGQGSIRLYRGSRRVGGRVSQESSRVLVFNPFARLKKKKSYRVVSAPVSDPLGNTGNSRIWRFTTGR